MPQAQTADINFTEILRQVAREKEIELDRWIRAIEDAMASAAKKQHRIKEPVRARLDPVTGKFEAFIVKTVVEKVEDPLAEWTLEEAQDHKADAQIGDEILLPISTEGLGRIAAQSAKQVLYQRIREAEREKIYEEYIGRVGEIVNGTVKRFERGDIIVDLGRTEAIVPRSPSSGNWRSATRNMDCWPGPASRFSTPWPGFPSPALPIVPRAFASSRPRPRLGRS